MESSRSQKCCGCGHSRAPWGKRKAKWRTRPCERGQLMQMVMWALELRREAICAPARWSEPLTLAREVT
jgi:hypothetical protein